MQVLAAIFEMFGASLKEEDETVPEFRARPLPRPAVKDSGEMKARTATLSDSRVHVDQNATTRLKLEVSHDATQEWLLNHRLEMERLRGPQSDGTAVIVKYNGGYAKYIWTMGTLVVERHVHPRKGNGVK